MNLSIQHATADDLPDLLRLNAEVHALHIDAKPEFFRAADPDGMSKHFAQKTVEDDSTVWIAQERGQTVGYLVATTKQRPANVFSPGRRWTELEEIGVAPEQRRRGVARRLIEAAVAAAQQAGIDDIELTVWSFNEGAQQAFRQMGFVSQNTRMTYGK